MFALAQNLIKSQETETRKITLQDEPSFANAIDCMVSYFYEGSYKASKYGTSQVLLHAEVVIIADKYDCPSLLTLATSFLRGSLRSGTMKSTDWPALASFIYEHTLTDASAHAELRKVVVNCLWECSQSESLLHTDEMQALLRENADLATDLLLAANSDVQNAKRAQDGGSICRPGGLLHEFSHLQSSRADEIPSRKRPREQSWRQVSKWGPA
jgi:hypothetical protein